MARRKNAAALFEVIHADNRFPRRHSTSRWSLRAPRSWFGFGRSGSDEASAAPVAVETMEYESAADPAAAPRGPSLLSRAVALIPSMPRIGFTLDPERQIVRLQLSYTGALVSAFTIVVAVALAYLVGRQTSYRPLPALSEQTTEQLRNGPAYADVLDIGGGENDPPVAMAVAPAAAIPSRATPSAASATPRTSTTIASAVRSNTAPGAPPQQRAPSSSSQGVRPSAWTEPRPPDTFMVSDENRTVGLQYVIIQSYPEQERELAEAAKQTLVQHGILCTVERGLPYAPSWYCVVGITGFARVRDVPEYDAYIARIQQVSDQFAGTSKFKKFDPKPMRWREIKPFPATAKSSAAPAAPNRPTPKQ